MLRTLRGRGDLKPLLVLSSRADEAGKVQALDSGADDYVTNSDRMAGDHFVYRPEKMPALAALR